MKYTKNSRRRALEYEKDITDYWKKNKIFEKSVSNRPADNSYVFYDGPPFITGVPHAGTLLSSIIKDAIPRFFTMKGMRVERRWGWDCHGLPAEVFTEKKLGIQDKRDIGTKISLEEYITTCRDNMVQTGDAWESTIDRIGRWVNFEGAYKTMDKDYMESVWWAFKQLYEKGKIYEGEKVLLYCVRDATPISKAEVAMDNSYQDVTDPSVYVKLELKNAPSFIGGDASKESKVYLLAWTTTPWTLPANTAAAVNKDISYVSVLVNGEIFVMAEELVGRVLQDEQHKSVEHAVLHAFKGVKLVGLEYIPLFENRGKNAHKVWHADYVNLDEGTGIVHIAPAYGEEDYILGKEKGFPLVLNIDDNGFFDSGPWKGSYVWDANKQIAKDLLAQGIVYRIDYITHSYPHCHRCGTKLMYRAHPSWFMNISDQRQEMLEQNSDINWFPEHIKQGRFAKTVESAPDWNLSRDRFWATAMPVWKGVDSKGVEHLKVVGSYAELKELSGLELEDYHRPWVDDVTFTIKDVLYTRIDKVLDCWFESGSMPFAQFHYPFENVEKFEQSFPGDFIAEYVGQVRAWFYYLHAVNVGLFDAKAFRNVIVTGTLAGNDGRKMSKSFGNYTDPNELMDTYSADSLRFLLLSSPVLNAEDYSLKDKEVGDVARKLSMIWNMYDFFTLYADVDEWVWNGDTGNPVLTTETPNPLDDWIISRLHQVTTEVDKNMLRYDLPNAMKPILPFIDDASNWFVRRSRKRFWKSENDADKQMAYITLHYVLTQLSVLLAPFTPFLAEELYRKMTDGESVHLLDWPANGHVNELLLEEMSVTRDAIVKSLSARAQAQVKVRQPLAKVTVRSNHEFHPEAGFDPIGVIQDEVNVKAVEVIYDKEITTLEIELDTTITDELRHEGQMREIVRNVQNARKEAGFDIDNRIDLWLQTDDKDLVKAYSTKELEEQLKQEVLATTLNKTKDTDVDWVTVVIDGASLNIYLVKN